jgi:hypothetical protein
MLEQQHNQDPGMVMHQLLDDEERLKGVLRVTGEQRGAWIECGSDILIHDNTYNMDHLGYKLAVFSGICKEGRTIPIGQCFVIDEESGSYNWQLRMWLAAHDNFAPLVIITYADPAVVCVVADVFPNASHIWSLYHLIANIFKNCRGVVDGALGQLVVNFLTVSKTITNEAFHARCDPHPFPCIPLAHPTPNISKCPLLTLRPSSSSRDVPRGNLNRLNEI